MLKETGGQYQLKETRLPMMGMFEGSSQTMIYITAYESDRITTYPYLQAIFANPQEIQIEIPISTVILNVVAESIAIMTTLSIMNPQQQTSIFDPIQRLVNRFEELQLNLLHNQDTIQRNMEVLRNTMLNKGIQDIYRQID